MSFKSATAMRLVTLIAFVSSVVWAHTPPTGAVDTFNSKEGFSLNLALEKGILNWRGRGGARFNTKRFRFLRSTVVTSQWTAQFLCSLAGRISEKGNRETIPCEKHASWPDDKVDSGLALSFTIERKIRVSGESESYAIQDFRATGELERIALNSYFPIVTLFAKDTIEIQPVTLGKEVGTSPFALSRYVQDLLQTFSVGFGKEGIDYAVGSKTELTVTVRSSGRSAQISLLTVPGKQDSGIASKAVIIKRLKDKLAHPSDNVAPF